MRHQLRPTLFFSCKNMLTHSEPNEITTMFLNFGKSEPQRSYKHGS